jgi:hypothetical protein
VPSSSNRNGPLIFSIWDAAVLEGHDALAISSSFCIATTGSESGPTNFVPPTFSFAQAQWAGYRRHGSRIPRKRNAAPGRTGDLVRPRIGADLQVVAAAVVGALDQEPAHAGLPHLAMGDLLFARSQHNSADRLRRKGSKDW